MPASVRFDQGLGQWQAKARPLVLAAEIAVDLAELRQRLWNVFRRDANSRVHDLEHEATVGAAPRPHRDLTTSIGELDRIGQ